MLCCWEVEGRMGGGGLDLLGGTRRKGGIGGGCFLWSEMKCFGRRNCLTKLLAVRGDLARLFGPRHACY